MAGLAEEGEGDDGLAGFAGLGEEFFFEFVRERHLAGGDLFVCCRDETEFATGEGIAFGDADWRPKDAAGHGAKGVDVAESGFGVEGWAWCVIGEVLEAGLVEFGGAEDAGCWISGEAGAVLLDPGAGTIAEHLSGAGVGSLQGVYAGLNASGIEGADRESAVTALGASGAASEHGAGAMGGIGECGVHDLD